MKRAILRILLALVVLLVGAATFLGARHARAVAQIEREWESMAPARIGALEATSRLEILPLYEEAGDPSRFQVGHGVAYLIKTDGATILMDVGNSAPKGERSPVVHNMNVLGVTWDEIDAILISHAHPDHVGGLAAWRRHTLALGNPPVDLSGKPMVVPVSLSYAGAEVTVATESTVIAPSVATVGAIPYPEIFPLSLFNPRGAEQSIVVNVAGNGLVLITGCGHPALERLVARAEALFDLPVVGSALPFSEEIYRVMGASGLTETHWRVINVRTQGRVCEGIFCKPEVRLCKEKPR